MPNVKLTFLAAGRDSIVLELPGSTTVRALKHMLEVVLGGGARVTYVSLCVS
jgi:hypothetical protein